ncbi:Lrp/AsnC family leucine-responsive transcriptional regulator [Anaerosolibacter carboniphilus]|uniref:Lrp/AsnC family leucine-responsive transcriptional regulator n=1 Tax=Anaerosolibacter carboniphilus TaxID=1417629 RepID=A0A841KRI1_9FIRM|nr:Lrp/AsnC family transcriptional regulator [Anaerosolibacter carboniphilus]MBB6216017.1 Lrp/AsnC family leucine-responsive transcriptional regulator [Anaerosolibacter carboniphilus]
MDDVDIRILKLLEEDGRITHEEISKHLHISRPAVHKRIGKLEELGIIRGYRGIIHWGKLGQSIKVHVFIKFNPLNMNDTLNQIISLDVPNVTIEEAHRLAGEWCLVLKARATSPDDIKNLIDKMYGIPGVKETSTTFILSTIIENGLKDF